MEFLKKYFGNTRKPQGFMGKMMIFGMNAGHSKMSAWARERFPFMKPENIIDLGCGGGKNIEALMKMYPKAKLTGLDYSEVSVAQSRKLNQKAIELGKCRILQGDVSALPFEDESFELATAFETVYFWPGPTESFSEVCRVIKPGGKFIIINEADGSSEEDKKWENLVEGMKLYSIEKMCSMLKDAGFKNVSMTRWEEKRWILFVAEK